LLLFMDEVQCGHFRSGRFQSYQRILENEGNGQHGAFLPDAVSMAKSLGGGFPIGAFWVRAPYADLLSSGTHGSTYGGSPLACAVALKILDVIEKEDLVENVRRMGDYLKNGLQELGGKYPALIQTVRGLGLMIGLELKPNIRNLQGDLTKSQAVRLVNLLHNAGLLAIPAGMNVLRFLPALNLRKPEVDEGLRIIESVLGGLKS